jgi:hypothetical protein
LHNGERWPCIQELVTDGKISLWLVREFRNSKYFHPTLGFRIRANGRAIRVKECRPKDVENFLASKPVLDANYITGTEACKPPYNLTPKRLAQGLLAGAIHASPDPGANGAIRYFQPEVASYARIDRTLGPSDPHFDEDRTEWWPTSLVEERHAIKEQVLNGLRRRDERNARLNGSTKKTGRPPEVRPIQNKKIERNHPRIPNGMIRVWLRTDVEGYIAWRKKKAGIEEVFPTETMLEQPAPNGMPEATVAPTPSSEANAHDYISASDARLVTAMSFQALNKLCRDGGPVRFRRPHPRRLLIHLHDLVVWLKKRSGIKE